MKYLVAAGLLSFFASATAFAQPAPALSADDQKVIAIAAASPCREGDKSAGTGSWNEDPKDKDKAPLGYIKGVALVYAKSYCEFKSAADTAVTVMKRPLESDAHDALAFYQITATNDADRLRAVYTLGIGVGMRESTGNTTEGRDKDAKKPPTAENAEAGAFQTSFDSFKADPSLAKLLTQYKANPNGCRLAVFLEGIKDLHKPVIGTGAGADFQKFTKECPAFATEYAMVMFRVKRTHYGTINNKHAKFIPVCTAMLKEIEAAVTCSP